MTPASDDRTHGWEPCHRLGTTRIDGERVTVQCGRPLGHDDYHRVATDWLVEQFCPHSHGVVGVTCRSCSQQYDYSHLTVH